MDGPTGPDMKGLTMTRYHPALVTLHWLLAAMITLALFMGGIFLSGMPNDDPSKVFGLRGHMTFGIAILALMLVRLVVRLSSKKPPRADAGNPLLNSISVLVHWALYISVIAMALSGLALAIAAGLPAIVFGGSGDPLPVDFLIYPPRMVHGLLANVLVVLIIAHIAGFLYHQFIRRDGLFRRMWFGDRSV